MIECGQPVAQGQRKSLVVLACHSVQSLQHLLQLKNHRRRTYTCLGVFLEAE